MNEKILGVIAYLDSAEVDNLLASIEGGLVGQFAEKYKDSEIQKGKNSIDVSHVSLNTGVRIEPICEKASEAIKLTSPISRLSALRKILIDNKYMRQINTVNIDKRGEFQEGELVEVHGKVTSALGEFIDNAIEFIKSEPEQIGELFGSAVKIDPKLVQALKPLEFITSKGIPIQILCDKEKYREGFDFALILVPDCLKVKKNSLTGTFNVLGRVKRVLDNKEEIYSFNLVPGMSNLSRERVESLMSNFTKKSIPGLSIDVVGKSLQIKYPTVVISPIAMYS